MQQEGLPQSASAFCNGFEGPSSMMELKVILDFACCGCQELVSVTVKCAGKGLAHAGRSVATVPVPCPTCHTVNQLYFEPNGTVRAVTPVTGPRSLPEPSMN
jgi:phage FluMu protein Com